MEEALKAKGLAISFSPQKGRCLLASRRFSTGETLLSQEPYTAVLNNDAKGKRCDSCLKPITTLKRCSACKCVWYCSTSCQRNEWKCHQHECKAMMKLMEEKQRKLTSLLLLVLRIIIKRHLEINKAIPCSALDNYANVEALATHYSDTTEEQKISYAQLANLVHPICSFGGIDIKYATEIFCRLACNAHTICDEELRPLGTGLYPVLSIINHSCQPNSVIIFHGKEATVRAIEPIMDGDEVTVSYVEIAASTNDRQRVLKEQYFFSCNCSLCNNDMGNPQNMMDHCSTKVSGDNEKLTCLSCDIKDKNDKSLKQLEVIDTNMKEAAKFLSQGNMVGARHAYESVERIQAKIFHPGSISAMKVHDELLKVCMSLEDWMSALKYCQKTIPAYERVYPPFHPLIGLQWYVCGKLEWYVGNSKEACKAFTKALEVLVVTHGQRSELVMNLRSTLQEAQAEVSYLQRNV